MTIELQCEACGAKYKVQSEGAGRTFSCQKCGNSLHVPKAPPAAERSWKRPALIGSGVAGVLVIVGLINLMFQRSQPAAVPSVDPENTAATSTGSNDVRDGSFGDETQTDSGGADGAAGRRYPSLPEAVPDRPHWLGADAPFDVKRYFAVPAPKDNAAPLYLDALFEFSAGVAECFSAQEQSERIPRVRGRARQFTSLFQKWSQDPGSVPQVERDGCLLSYSVAFEKLSRAQARKHCVFEAGIEFTSDFCHVQPAREAANVLALRIARDLELRDMNRVTDGLRILLRLSRDLRPRGTAKTQLAGIEIADVALRHVPSLAASEGFTVDDCDRLLGVLQEHESHALDPFFEGLRTNYIMSRKLLLTVEHRTGAFEKRKMMDTFGLTKDSVGYVLASVLYDLPGNAVLAKAEELDGKLATMTADDFEKELQTLNECYRSMLELELQPTRDRFSVAAAAEQRLRAETMILGFSGPFQQLVEAAALNQARLRGNTCLVALRRWRLQFTEAPQDLFAVVKAAKLPASPIDPYSGGPFRLATVQGEPVVYSVGRDGKDDNASSEWDTTNPQGVGDLVFRFAKPARPSHPQAKPSRTGF